MATIKSYLANLRGHEGGIPSSVDPHAVEGQLQTGVSLRQAAAKVSDNQTRATICQKKKKKIR